MLFYRYGATLPTNKMNSSAFFGNFHSSFLADTTVSTGDKEGSTPTVNIEVFIDKVFSSTGITTSCVLLIIKNISLISTK